MSLVHIVNKSTLEHSRVPREVATRLMAERPGQFHFTSKSCTKKFYKRLVAYYQKEDMLSKVDFTTDQKDNFVVEEKGKVIGHIFRGTKTHTITIPAEKEKAEEKLSWVESTIEKYCINPNDHTLKSNLIAKLAILLGFFKKFKKKEEPKERVETFQLPMYQRIILGYGTLKDMRRA